MGPQVILVDENDQEIGTMAKLTAHREGRLHRAVSAFVFNQDGHLLLQQRAQEKYHSAGLWSNTCCGHPLPGETALAAMHRRLKEEMGFDCDLQEVHAFSYRVEFANGLIEHEFDHVFVGRFDGVPRPDPQEAIAWQWMALPVLEEEMRADPDKYTYWFRHSLKDVLARSGR